MQRFAQELTRTGTAAKVASLKAQADAIREEKQLKMTAIATERARMARERDRGASAAQLRGISAKIAVMQKEATELEKQAMAYDRQATQLMRQTQQLQHLRNVSTQTGVALETVGVAFGFLGVAGLAAVGSLVSGAVEYQRQVAATATQVDGFGEKLSVISDIGKRVAGAIAVPFEQVQPALYDIFSSMEIGTADAEVLLTAFAKAAVAGQTDVQSASRATIGIMNAFQVPVSQVNHLLDLQFQLVQEGVGTYQEWTDRIGAVSPSAVRAGQSIEMMLAALATTTRLGIPAARSATAVARAFDAMSNPKAIDDMEAFGVTVRNADGSLRPFNLVLHEFRDRLAQIPEADRVGKILDVFQGAGSTIEARKFLQSMLLGKQGLELFDNILNQMNTDTGSFEQAYDIMSNTVAMRSEVLSNKWKILKETLGEALMPQLEKLIGFLERIFNWFDTLSPRTKNMIAQFLLWGAVISVAIGIFLTLLGVFAVFAASISATYTLLLPLIGAVVGIGVALFGLAGILYLAWTRSEQFREGVKGAFHALEDIGKIVYDVAKNMYEGFKTYVQPALEKVADVIEQRVLPAFNTFMTEVWDKIKPKLEEAQRAIDEIADKAFPKIGAVIEKYVIPAINHLTDWWNNNKESLMPLIDILAQVLKWLLIIGAVIVGSIIIGMGALVIVIGLVIGGWIALVEVGQLVWGLLKALWEGTINFGKAFADMAVKIWDALKGAWHAVQNFFMDLGSTLSDLPGKMYNAAVNTIQGFANGVQDKIGSVTAVIRNLGGAVISALKAILGIGSPSKIMFEMGGDSAQGYINGWQRTMGDAMLGMPTTYLGQRPAALAPNEQPRVGSVGAPASMFNNGGGGEKTINNNITVYTRELDPREQAAKLGWELAGRM